MNHRVQGQHCQRYAGTPFYTAPMKNLAPEKAQLREQLRARRHALDASTQRDAGLHLAAFATQIPAWADARHIALYLPNDGEIDTGPLLEHARQQRKTVLLPVISGNSLQFAVWDSATPLINNRYNIPEPHADAERLTPAAIDIIFLPLVGWDQSGGRLGMGGGFYDRSLAGVVGPLRVGLAHRCQQVASVPRDNLDVTLDFVATDSALTACQSRRNQNR